MPGANEKVSSLLTVSRLNEADIWSTRTENHSAAEHIQPSGTSINADAHSTSAHMCLKRNERCLLVALHLPVAVAHACIIDGAGSVSRARVRAAARLRQRHESANARNENSAECLPHPSRRGHRRRWPCCSDRFVPRLRNRGHSTFSSSFSIVGCTRDVPACVGPARSSVKEQGLV